MMGIQQLTIEKATERILMAMAEDLKRPGLVDTPRRVSAMYAEFFDREELNLTTFPNQPPYDEIVLVKDIDFVSFCEHHMLPFFGRCHIGYIPNKLLLGLSKFPRTVEYFSKELQMQERLTAQICNFLTKKLNPLGLGVVIEATHLCMLIRGVKQQHTITKTSQVSGVFFDKPEARQEFFSLIG